MNGRVLLRVLALLGLFAAPFAHAEAVTPQCGIPVDFAAGVGILPQVADALAHHRLDILAIGSATMQGPDKSPPDISFPFQMLQALRDAQPDAAVTLEVDSQRGLTAADQLEKMRVAISRHPYRLVLWQTGTVEAVRNLSPADFSDTLADGAGLAHGAQADVVLIDPQFSRFLRANANVEPYQAALQQAASLPDVLLFRRYDLMRGWAEDGRIDLEHTKPADRLATAERLHLCLGVALAQLILAGAAPHAR